MSIGNSAAACIALTATLLAPALGRAETSTPGAASPPAPAPAKTAVHASWDRRGPS